MAYTSRDLQNPAHSFSKWADNIGDLHTPEQKRIGWIVGLGGIAICSVGFWLYRRGKKSQDAAASGDQMASAPPPPSVPAQ